MGSYDVWFFGSFLVLVSSTLLTFVAGFWISSAFGFPGFIGYMLFLFVVGSVMMFIGQED